MIRALSLLVREAPAVQAGQEEDRSPSTFVASTQDEGRDGLILLQDTWRLDNYRKNPVILWAHDATSPPIGRAELVEVQSGRLIVRVAWDWQDERAADIARRVKRGSLNAVSVRWRPDEVIARWRLPKSDPMYSEDGYICRDNELLEISVVTVPGDPGALATQRAAEGIDYERLADLIAARMRPAEPAPADWVAALPPGEPDWVAALPS